MKNILMGGAAALLLWPVQAQAAAPRDPMGGYHKCLDDMAETLDDHMSDAGTIGEAVAALCSSERVQFIVESAPADQPAVLTQSLLDDKGEARETAVSRVLLERARFRDKPRANR